MLTPGFLQLLGLLSVVMFFGSLIAIPFIITRLPQDYFIRHNQVVRQRRKRHPLLMRILSLVRNLVGLLLVAAGLVMLILPGQGLLTILIGISIMDFPGKHQKITWLASRPGVRKSLNWIRRRAGKPLFSFEEARNPSRPPLEHGS